MDYSSFTLNDIEKRLEIEIKSVFGLFDNIEPVAISPHLAETLRENVPLAIAVSTEKARSELIVSPMLVELRKSLNREISVFSGVEFNVDFEKGLNGVCDFLVSQSSQQLLVHAPIITLVEAKNDNIKSGLPQCIAEMVAARIFNEREQSSVQNIFGVVTTGSVWSFLKLEGDKVLIDINGYPIENAEEIFGILLSMVNDSRS